MLYIYTSLTMEGEPSEGFDQVKRMYPDESDLETSVFRFLSEYMYDWARENITNNPFLTFEKVYDENREVVITGFKGNVLGSYKDADGNSVFITALDSITILP